MLTFTGTVTVTRRMKVLRVTGAVAPGALRGVTLEMDDGTTLFLEVGATIEVGATTEIRADGDRPSSSTITRIDMAPRAG